MDARDVGGRTALLEAARFDRGEVARVLLQLGADRSAKSEEGVRLCNDDAQRKKLASYVFFSTNGKMCVASCVFFSKNGKNMCFDCLILQVSMFALNLCALEELSPKFWTKNEMRSFFFSICPTD